MEVMSILAKASVALITLKASKSLITLQDEAYNLQTVIIIFLITLYNMFLGVYRQ